MLLEKTPRPSNGIFKSSVDITSDDGDAVVVLVDADNLEAINHTGAGALGSRAQDRLEARLGDEQTAARA